MALFNAHGKVSWFGGPDDDGVSSSEDLAWWESWNQVVADGAEHLFLPQQPPGTTGLARRLNVEGAFYVACRWDYNTTPKTMLADKRYRARVSAGGRSFLAHPADWGPHEEQTGRAADISLALMSALGITTDDIVDVEYPYEEVIAMSKIALSSGHSKLCRGAVGIIDEWENNVRMVDRVHELITAGGGTCVKFHDLTSTSQNENLNKTSNWHNSQTRDYDCQIHFNAFAPTNDPMGTECWYVTQSSLAGKISAAQASSGGFINRGGKYTSGLHFLNATNKPAVLTEICFVDSGTDCGLYEENFDAVCQALAYALVPELQIPDMPPPTEPPVTVEQVVDVQIYAPRGVRVDVSVNQRTEG
jgi:N-acetylmuramoyl-L-alanine amidase